MKATIEALGGTCLDKQTFAWYGRFMNDSPIPEGMDPEDYGKCLWAAAFPDSEYEVGVIKALNGKPGFQLVWDEWGPGKKINERLGSSCEKFTQTYQTKRIIAAAEKQVRNKKCTSYKLSTSADTTVLELEMPV